MASSSWITDANFQKRIYEKSAKLIIAVENQDLKLLELCDEFKDVPAIGEAGGVRFPITVFDPKNISGGNNGGVEQNDYNDGIDVQCSVAAVEVSAGFEINEMLINTGTAEGAFENELSRKIRQTTQALSKMLQRYMCVSHGTGRLAVVDADTSASLTFVASVNPSYAYGLAGLMGRDVVDIYNLDSGGAAQYSGVMITALDRRTGIVTTNTSMTLTAGWGVYGQNRYGLAINGLRNLIDDGTTAAAIEGQTRATYPSALNSVCSNVFNGGASVQMTQAMIEPLMNEVQANGGTIEFLYCNPGVRDTFNNANITMRQWQIANGSGAFSQTLGQKDDGKYVFDGKNIPVKVDVNALPFALYGFSKGLMRKYVAKPMGWMMRGGSMFHPGIASSGQPKTTWTATNVAELNIGIQKPSWALGLFGLRDSFNGRDAVV